LKEYLYNFAFFPLPIIWFMLIIIIFNIKNISAYFKAIFIILFLLSLPIIIELIKFPLNIGAAKYSPEDSISAIIVLTGGAYKDINNKWYPSRTSITRTVIANNIAKKLNVPLIILGGKQNLGQPAESLIVSNYINNDNMSLDFKSKNTYQSVNNIEKILLQNNLNKQDTFLVITSKIHNLRTALTFKSQNYKVKLYNYPSIRIFDVRQFLPNSKSFLLLNNCLYEYFGIIKYILLGYIKIDIY
jgi:uncharacterized SAM-binding protein YcdF (DUF218 family)